MKNELLTDIKYENARDLLLTKVRPVLSEKTILTECYGRILAQDLYARENNPPFDKSAYDGYALRAADVENASQQKPVTLRIVEYIPAGSVGQYSLGPQTAARIATGAPVPQGADSVINFERTIFTEKTVTFSAPVKKGVNIIRAGEDIAAGDLLAKSGSVIDPGTAGSLAAQGVSKPEVYKIPSVGIISTGNEIIDLDDSVQDGKIRNSNRYMLAAALSKLGIASRYLGRAGDSAADISKLISRGIDECDAVISTGGVSVGDFDLTADAMEMAGAEILIKGVLLKPGMACAYGMKGQKPIFALSGNPASAITSFYAIVSPVLKKMAGWSAVIPDEISVSLNSAFSKRSQYTRLLRGKLDLSDGTARFELPMKQGNAMLSSFIGSDVIAIIPAGSADLPAGTQLKGFLI